MEEYELDYDVQEVRLSEEHVFKVTTVANEALPLEMLLELETRRYRAEQSTKHHADRRRSAHGYCCCSPTAVPCSTSYPVQPFSATTRRLYNNTTSHRIHSPSEFRRARAGSFGRKPHPDDNPIPTPVRRRGVYVRTAVPGLGINRGDLRVPRYVSPWRRVP